MIKIIKNKILQVGAATGIEVCLLEKGEIAINLATVKVNKGRLIKVNEHHFITQFSELKEKLSKGFPISLIVSGKGIIYKKLPTSEIPENPLETILPTANPSEFYIEIAKSNDYTYLSIIRKDLLEKLISDLKILECRILSVSIGGFKDLAKILPLMGTNDQFIHTSCYRITRNKNNTLEGIETISLNKGNYEKVELNIGDQYVFSPSILAFATATSLIANPVNSIFNSIKSIAQEQESFIYFKMYKTFLWASLISLFFILITNFLLFNFYFAKNLEMGSIQSISAAEEGKDGAMKTDIQRKESFIRENKWTNQTMESLLSDRIGSMVAGGLTLTSMDLNPIYSNDLYNNEGPIFKKDTIEITGNCDSPEDLNVFINNVKESNMFKSVNIKNYSYKRETAKGYFSIEIVASR